MAKYTAYLIYYIYLQKHMYIYKWTSYKKKFEVNCVVQVLAENTSICNLPLFSKLIWLGSLALLYFLI